MLFKWIGLELRASKIDTYFDKGLIMRNELINDVIGESGKFKIEDYKMIINHKRNLPVDREAIFDMAVKANGIFSLESVLKLFPKSIIDDVDKELERIKKQRPDVDLDNLTVDD